MKNSATPPSKIIRTAVSVREGVNRDRDGSTWVESSANSLKPILFWLNCEEILGPVDKREAHKRRQKPRISGQTNSREDHYARVAPTLSLSIIQTQVAPSLQAPASVVNVAMRLAEGHLLSRCPLRVLVMSCRPPYGVVSRLTGLDRIRMEPYCLQQRIKIQFG